MKKQLWTALLATVAISSGLASPLVAQESSPVSELVDSLGQRCNRATEVSYRSNQLAMPEGITKVYVEAIIRKIVNANSPFRQVDTEDYCYADLRETLQRTLVIERGEEIQRIAITPDISGYWFYDPIAFSADGRYLAADVQIAYTGGDPGAEIAIFDLDNGEMVQLPEICEAFEFKNQVGFISPTEVMVHCTAYGDLAEQFEVIDLQSGEVSQPATQPTEVVTSGNTVGAFEVTKTQYFY